LAFLFSDTIAPIAAFFYGEYIRGKVFLVLDFGDDANERRLPENTSVKRCGYNSTCESEI
jgi:hypothetical protein